MLLHEDGHFELEPEDTDVTDSVIPDNYYEAPEGCCYPGECLIQHSHLLSDCYSQQFLS
jgi:hypothetical protein